MTNPDRIRIGFIGAGAICRTRHVPGLRAVPGVELAGVVNSTHESSARAAAEYGIARTYPTPEALIASDEIDAVWIGTQPYLHRPYAVAALEAGKHVFCQARMALDYADARRMYDAWKLTDRTAMLCPPPHYMRGDRVIRRLLAEHYVGDIFHVNVRSFIEDYADPHAPVHWRQIAAISGVNTMHLGMNLEVVHRWVGTLSRVSADALTLIPSRPAAQTNQGTGQTTVERPDSVAVAGRLAGGGLLSASFCGVGRFGAEPNMIEIYGSEGTIRYLSGTDAPGSGTILIGKRTDAQLHECPISPDEEMHWTAEADFIHAIREGRTDPEPSFLDGLQYMEVTDAIFQSVTSGRSVSLPLGAAL